jgi:hypothetical protein
MGWLVEEEFSFYESGPGPLAFWSMKSHNESLRSSGDPSNTPEGTFDRTCGKPFPSCRFDDLNGAVLLPVCAHHQRSGAKPSIRKLGMPLIPCLPPNKFPNHYRVDQKTSISVS